MHFKLYFKQTNKQTWLNPKLVSQIGIPNWYPKLVSQIGAKLVCKISVQNRCPKIMKKFKKKNQKKVFKKFE
jgi:hypothetical protein